MPDKPRLVVVAGPTASGKTACAVELCRLIDGEVVSADSMQIYRGMDVLSAMPTEAEMRGVPHHMLGVAEPSEKYTAATYRERANAVIAEIRKRGRQPVVCGGTGLYIDSVLKSVEFSPQKRDDKLRDELWKKAEQDGAESVYEILKELDPIEADKVHYNNVKRVIRAIEICKTTGMTKTEADKLSIGKPIYNPIIYGLNMPREKLYERIDRRVDVMVEQGLEGEVRQLLNMGIRRDSTAMQAIGYKELVRYIDGLCDFETAIEDIKRESRRYAKRQLTWFRRNPDIIWTEK